MTWRSRLRPIGRLGRTLQRAGAGTRSSQLLEPLEARRLLSGTLQVQGLFQSPEGDYTLALDADGEAVTSWRIDWGDGSESLAAAGATQAVHNYDGPASYTLRAWATVGAVERPAEVVGGQGGTGSFGLDPTFGVNGAGTVVRDDPFNVTDVAVQDDGKVLVAYTSGASLRVTRYDAAGALDLEFGNGGTAVIGSPAVQWQTNRASVAFRGGFIAVAGTTVNATVNDADFGVALLDAGGQPVKSFGETGVLTGQDFGGVDVARTVAIQPDGKVVVAGSTTALGGSNFLVARYTTAGTLDPAVDADNSGFGQAPADPNGWAIVDLGSADVATDVTVGPDGSIVAAGTSAGRFVVARFGAAGDITGRFRAGSGVYGQRAAVAVQPDGGIVVATERTTDTAPDVSLWRFLPAASGPQLVPDVTFGSAGSGEVTSGDASRADSAFDVEIQADGKIVVGGSATTDVPAHRILALTRFNVDGTPDASFGDDGARVLTDFGRDPDNNGLIETEAVGFGLTGDGKILAAGTHVTPANAGTLSRVILARYAASGGAPTELLLTVDNAAPAGLVTSGTVVPGHATEFTFSAQDASAVDQESFFDFEVDWGDGTSEFVLSPSPLVLTHAYAATPAQPLRVLVRDKDGGEGQASLAVVVNNAAAVVTDPFTGGQILVVGAADGAGGAGAANTFHVRSHSGGGVEVTLDGVTTVATGVEKVIVYGNGGGDNIQVTGALNVAVELYGGAGNDKLKGGDVNDVVAGGDGDDTLVGRGGRDFLVGGLGSDKIVGDADDDILIGGVYDAAADRLAVALVMAEWGRTDVDYFTRVDHLRGGGVPEARLNGFVFLAVAETDVHIDFNGNGQVDGGELIVFPPTVFDDLATDTLTGDSGLDWYFANRDGAEQDRITDLTDPQFADDLLFILAV